jgi:HK97 family phage major capsid protein
MASVVETLRSECADLKASVKDLEREHQGEAFPDKEKEKWNQLNRQIQEYETRIELEVRRETIEGLAEEGHVERVEDFKFQTKRPGSISGDEVFDLERVKADVRDPGVAGAQYKERAKGAIERAEIPYTGALTKEDAQEELTRLAERLDGTGGAMSRHILATGSPTYKRAFVKALTPNAYMTAEEGRAIDIARAASLTGTSGGFAVPFELDPSIIPTSNLAINPYRALGRVIPITVDEWRGVSSAGVTAAYAAEATAATDAAPTLAQPTISTEKARAFIPFSIEIGMDWASFSSEMGGLLADSKDELEAAKFTTGTGTNEPFGVITGATTVYTAAATNAIALADIYGWQASLGARFRPRSAFVMNIGIANRIRQFDTAGGAGLWVDTLKSGLAANPVSPGTMESNLLGKPVYESTTMSATMTTGQLIGVYGDWNYYVIVDRIGLTVETIPHLFDVTNNMPTGQRGLYAYWRNGAKVVDANAFRTLKLA